MPQVHCILSFDEKDLEKANFVFLLLVYQNALSTFHFELLPKHRRSRKSKKSIIIVKMIMLIFHYIVNIFVYWAKLIQKTMN